MAWQSQYDNKNEVRDILGERFEAVDHNNITPAQERDLIALAQRRNGIAMYEFERIYFGYVSGVISGCHDELSPADLGTCLERGRRELRKYLFRFDPNRGYRFKTLIYKRIAGIVADGERKITGRGKKSVKHMPSSAKPHPLRRKETIEDNVPVQPEVMTSNIRGILDSVRGALTANNVAGQEIDIFVNMLLTETGIPTEYIGSLDPERFEELRKMAATVLGNETYALRGPQKDKDRKGHHYFPNTWESELGPADGQRAPWRWAHYLSKGQTMKSTQDCPRINQTGDTHLFNQLFVPNSVRSEFSPWRVANLHRGNDSGAQEPGPNSDGRWSPACRQAGMADSPSTSSGLRSSQLTDKGGRKSLRRLFDRKLKSLEWVEIDINEQYFSHRARVSVFSVDEESYFIWDGPVLYLHGRIVNGTLYSEKYNCPITEILAELQEEEGINKLLLLFCNEKGVEVEIPKGMEVCYAKSKVLPFAFRTNLSDRNVGELEERVIEIAREDIVTFGDNAGIKYIYAVLATRWEFSGTEPRPADGFVRPDFDPALLRSPIGQALARMLTQAGVGFRSGNDAGAQEMAFRPDPSNVRGIETSCRRLFQLLEEARRAPEAKRQVYIKEMVDIIKSYLDYDLKEGKDKNFSTFINLLMSLAEDFQIHSADYIDILKEAFRQLVKKYNLTQDEEELLTSIEEWPSQFKDESFMEQISLIGDLIFDYIKCGGKPKEQEKISQVTPIPTQLVEKFDPTPFTAQRKAELLRIEIGFEAGREIWQEAVSRSNNSDELVRNLAIETVDCSMVRKLLNNIKGMKLLIKEVWTRPNEPERVEDWYEREFRMPLIERDDVGAAIEHFGFDSGFSAVVGLVFHELYTNILHHTAKGYLIVRKIVGEDNIEGVEIIARDCGPGMDIAKAIEKGFSTVGTKGVGLNQVIDFMDEVEILSRSTKWTKAEGFKSHDPVMSTIIIARKWQKRTKDSSSRHYVTQHSSPGDDVGPEASRDTVAYYRKPRDKSNFKLGQSREHSLVLRCFGQVSDDGPSVSEFGSLRVASWPGRNQLTVHSSQFTDEGGKDLSDLKARLVAFKKRLKEPEINQEVDRLKDPKAREGLLNLVDAEPIRERLQLNPAALGELKDLVLNFDSKSSPEFNRVLGLSKRVALAVLSLYLKQVVEGKQAPIIFVYGPHGRSANYGFYIEKLRAVKSMSKQTGQEVLVLLEEVLPAEEALLGSYPVLRRSDFTFTNMHRTEIVYRRVEDYIKYVNRLFEEINFGRIPNIEEITKGEIEFYQEIINYGFRVKMVSRRANFSGLTYLFQHRREASKAAFYSGRYEDYLRLSSEAIDLCVDSTIERDENYLEKIKEMKRGNPQVIFIVFRGRGHYYSGLHTKLEEKGFVADFVLPDEFNMELRTDIEEVIFRREKGSQFDKGEKEEIVARYMPALLLEDILGNRLSLASFSTNLMINISQRIVNRLNIEDIKELSRWLSTQHREDPKLVYQWLKDHGKIKDGEREYFEGSPSASPSTSLQCSPFVVILAILITILAILIGRNAAEVGEMVAGFDGLQAVPFLVGSVLGFRRVTREHNVINRCLLNKGQTSNSTGDSPLFNQLPVPYSVVSEFGPLRVAGFGDMGEGPSPPKRYEDFFEEEVGSGLLRDGAFERICSNGFLSRHFTNPYLFIHTDHRHFLDAVRHVKLARGFEGDLGLIIFDLHSDYNPRASELADATWVGFCKQEGIEDIYWVRPKQGYCGLETVYKGVADDVSKLPLKEMSKVSHWLVSFCGDYFSNHSYIVIDSTNRGLREEIDSIAETLFSSGLNLDLVGMAFSLDFSFPKHRKPAIEGIIESFGRPTASDVPPGSERPKALEDYQVSDFTNLTREKFLRVYLGLIATLSGKPLSDKEMAWLESFAQLFEETDGKSKCSKVTDAQTFADLSWILKHSRSYLDRDTAMLFPRSVLARFNVRIPKLCRDSLEGISVILKRNNIAHTLVTTYDIVNDGFHNFVIVNILGAEFVLDTTYDQFLMNLRPFDWEPTEVVMFPVHLLKTRLFAEDTEMYAKWIKFIEVCVDETGQIRKYTIRERSKDAKIILRGNFARDITVGIGRFGRQEIIQLFDSEENVQTRFLFLERCEGDKVRVSYGKSLVETDLVIIEDVESVNIRRIAGNKVSIEIVISNDGRKIIIVQPQYESRPATDGLAMREFNPAYTSPLMLSIQARMAQAPIWRSGNDSVAERAKGYRPVTKEKLILAYKRAEDKAERYPSYREIQAELKKLGVKGISKIQLYRYFAELRKSEHRKFRIRREGKLERELEELSDVRVISIYKKAQIQARANKIERYPTAKEMLAVLVIRCNLDTKTYLYKRMRRIRDSEGKRLKFRSERKLTNDKVDAAYNKARRRAWAIKYKRYPIYKEVLDVLRMPYKRANIRRLYRRLRELREITGRKYRFRGLVITQDVQYEMFGDEWDSQEFVED